MKPVFLIICVPIINQMMMILRIADEKDAQGILDIYSPYIRDTSLTFETEVPAVASFRERIRNGLINWPWIVGEENGVIAGYAYAARHRERKAYQWSVESSVYIHPDYRRAGLATALYTALFEILKRQGFHNVYAVINLPNVNSVSLHEALGFSWFATYENVGFKLGAWKNVGWWKLAVNSYENNPPDPLPLKNVDPAFIDSVFSRSQSLLKK